jgi:hypothetical protein
MLYILVKRMVLSGVVLSLFAYWRGSYRQVLDRLHAPLSATIFYLSTSFKAWVRTSTGTVVQVQVLVQVLTTLSTAPKREN